MFKVGPLSAPSAQHLSGSWPISCTWKWNESGFRPPLCTYRLNWARRTSWGWWDDWDDTVLQTQDSKFEPWRSEAEHATSRSRRLPTILTFTRGWGRNNFVSFKPPRPGTEPRTLAWKAAVLTTTLGPPPNIVYILGEFVLCSTIWTPCTQEFISDSNVVTGKRNTSNVIQDSQLLFHSLCVYILYIYIYIGRMNTVYLTISGRGPSLYVRIWRLQKSDSDV